MSVLRHFFVFDWLIQVDRAFAPLEFPVGDQ